MSFISDVMSPGGGVMLLPFVRLVVIFLLLLTSTAFLCGVARIHMAVLSFLGGGLLLSLSFFEAEYKKAQKRASGQPATGPAATTTKQPSATKTSGGKVAAKTD